MRYLILCLISTFICLKAQTPGGCWIKSYGRGVGTPISTCPSGTDQNGALCYPQCQDGFTGVGPVCWQNCPNGFKDTGIDCLKPSSYGRGAGYPLWEKSKCEKENPQGCEKSGALYYPKCKEGFHAFGCCVCSPNCVDGMTDIGVSCQKQSYGRGAGNPLICSAGKEEDAGLCYNQCKPGYDGVGPVCWGTCPSGMYQCGALCLPTEGDCTADMLQIGSDVFELIGEIASEDSDDDDEPIDVEETTDDLAKQLNYPICNN